MGVGDGVEVASGRVVGAALGVELLGVTAWDAPQAARKHRLRTFFHQASPLLPLSLRESS